MDVNDRVVLKGKYALKYPGVWIITKKLKVNFNLRHETTGKILRCSPSLLLPAPFDSAVTVVAPIFSHLEVGTIVSIKSGSHPKIKDDELFVILQDKGYTVKMVKLGGDGGKYWPNASRDWVDKVIHPSNLIHVK